ARCGGGGAAAIGSLNPPDACRAAAPALDVFAKPREIHQPPECRRPLAAIALAPAVASGGPERLDPAHFGLYRLAPVGERVDHFPIRRIRKDGPPQQPPPLLRAPEGELFPPRSQPAVPRLHEPQGRRSRRRPFHPLPPTRLAAPP